MGRLTPGEFLIELDKLFAACREQGSVYVVMKQTNLRSRKWNAEHASEQEQASHSSVCLIRAYNGAKRKLSTEIGAKEGHGRFAQQLQLMLRANMDGLRVRKRTRTKAVKTKGGS